MNRFTHLDEEGKAIMVDVSHKKPQLRLARAKGIIYLEPETLEMIKERRMEKGDVLAVAELAGIQAAKRAFELIPLCHLLPLTNAKVKAAVEEEGIEVHSEISCVGLTGVEMEALTAVSVALLTVYDMCKAVDKNMVIDDITLIEKLKKDLD
ncbi:cyclic pyranopterin monophosphate synthase MoaC [bacterium]|nr:cyclic pyranopterin monophosphate synthase MoaC [bacterium]